MKNYKLLAVAFSLLFVGQIGAVEKAGIDPCESGKSWLRGMKKATEDHNRTWSHQCAALALCARNEDGKNGIEDGSFSNLFALSQESSQEGSEAKAIIDEFKKSLELFFHQPMIEKNYIEVFKAFEIAGDKYRSNKTKKNKKVFKKAKSFFNDKLKKVTELAMKMQDKINKIKNQAEEGISTQEQGWTNPDLNLKKYVILAFEREMFRLINAEFVPEDLKQLNPQDYLDEADKELYENVSNFFQKQ